MQTSSGPDLVNLLQRWNSWRITFEVSETISILQKSNCEDLMKSSVAFGFLVSVILLGGYQLTKDSNLAMLAGIILSITAMVGLGKGNV
jgi:hypothetical protein